MSKPDEERLNVLSEIAMERLNINVFSQPALPETRVVVSVEDIVQALESAYDMGLIAGCHLIRSMRTC